MISFQAQQQQLQQAQQLQAQRSYSASATSRSQIQNSMNGRQPAQAGYNQYSLQLGINAAQAPPPLVRSAAAQL